MNKYAQVYLESLNKVAITPGALDVAQGLSYDRARLAEKDSLKNSSGLGVLLSLLGLVGGGLAGAGIGKGLSKAVNPLHELDGGLLTALGGASAGMGVGMPVGQGIGNLISPPQKKASDEAIAEKTKSINPTVAKILALFTGPVGPAIHGGIEANSIGQSLRSGGRTAAEGLAGGLGGAGLAALLGTALTKGKPGFGTLLGAELGAIGGGYAGMAHGAGRAAENFNERMATKSAGLGSSVDDVLKALTPYANLKGLKGQAVPAALGSGVGAMEVNEGDDWKARLGKILAGAAAGVGGAHLGSATAKPLDQFLTRHGL